MKVLRIAFLFLFCLAITAPLGVYAQRIGNQYRMPQQTQTQQTQQTQGTKQSQQTKGTETKPSYKAPQYKQPKTGRISEEKKPGIQIQGSLQQKGKKLLLRTNQSVKKIEVFAGNKKIGELGGGRSFDVTKYLSQTHRNQLKFIYHDQKGQTSSQSLATHEYKSLVMPPEPLDKGAKTKMPVDPIEKAKGTTMPPDPLGKGRGTHIAPHAVGGMKTRGAVSEGEEEEEEEEPLQTRPNPMQRFFNIFKGRGKTQQQGVSTMGAGAVSSGEPTGAVPGRGPVSWDPTDKPQGSMGTSSVSSGAPSGPAVPGSGPVSWDPGEMPQDTQKMKQMGR